MGEKVLIAEDDLDLLDVFKMILENLGYQTIVAENGKQAVEMASDHLPNLIILDIDMPVMDGFEAARLIRKDPRTCSIPLLTTTARALFKDRTECLQNGFDDYLSKPFSHRQLRRCIENLLKIV